ncbi:MAG: hypothetical protein C4294_03730 [Nitrospiraceae bacterium]
MATPVKRAALEEVLIQRGAISRAHAEALRRHAPATRRPFRAVLLEAGAVSEPVLAEAVAEQYGLPFDPLKEFRVDPAFFKTIPLEWMQRHPFVPLAETDGVLTLAVADPQDVRALDELELRLGRESRLVISTRTAILDALTQSEGSRQVMTRIQEAFRPVLVREDEHGEEVLSLEKITKDQSPVVKLVDTIILTALQKRASDIHIEAGERSRGQISDRRPALPGDGAAGCEIPCAVDLPLEGHVRAGYRRAPGAAGRPVQTAGRSADGGFPRLDPAQRLRRIGCHPDFGKGGHARRPPRTPPRERRLQRRRPAPLSAGHYQALWDGVSDGADRQWQDHHAVCRGEPVGALFIDQLVGICSERVRHPIFGSWCR